MSKNFTVSTSPHISKPLSTQRVMFDVAAGLLPAVAAAGYYFRIRALLLIAVCVVSCMVSEWLCNVVRK